MTITEQPTTAAAPGMGHLIGSEWLRARSRRGTRWLLLASLVGMAAVAAVMWFTTAEVTQASLDEAADRFMVEQMQYYEQCMADPTIPEAEKVNGACWKPSAEDARSNAYWSLDRRAFGQESLDGLLALAGGIGAVVCLLVAASAGGADWGARTMGLLLSWEPRRLRVFAVRLGVTVLIALVIEAVLVGLALAAGSFIAQRHGLLVSDPMQQYLLPADLAAGRELALRWLPMAVLAAAGSFGLAMATRSTGWAIGASIGFVAVIESVVQGAWAWGSQWLVQTNLIAWLQGGVSWVVDRRPEAILETGPESYLGPGQIWISQGRALGTLSAMVLLVLVGSALLLTRRDVD